MLVCLVFTFASLGRKIVLCYGLLLRWWFWCCGFGLLSICVSWFECYGLLCGFVVWCLLLLADLLWYCGCVAVGVLLGLRDLRFVV